MQKSASESEHRELADLREVVLNKEEFEHYDGSAEEVHYDSIYPYTVQKAPLYSEAVKPGSKCLRLCLRAISSS